MTKINTIITGHGNFASGIGSSLKLLSGEHDEITLVDFTESMSELDLGEKLADSLQQDIPTLYFTDLAGGTPFKEAIKISIDKPDVEVVSGCNLAALLETMFNDYDNVQAYAKDLVEITKKTADLADFSTNIEEENIDDGI